MAVCVGEVYCWAQVCAEKPKAVEPSAVISTAKISVPLQTQRGCSTPVTESSGSAIVARIAVVATCTTASAPTE